MEPLAVSSAAEHWERPPVELADVFRLYGEAYRSAHPLLPASHTRVMRDIELCRTAALGGHLERCPACGFERPAYDSCRNRHCPKCLGWAKAKWLLAREAELLPVPYFHAVFTLPHELNPLVLANLRPLVALLFHAVSQTLLTFGRNELRGTIGFVAILHTWDQLLRSHFHLHCLIPGGALALDASRWIRSSPKSLFRVEPLARVFRGTFLEGLKTHVAKAELRFPTKTASLANPEDFPRRLDTLYAKDWVVYCKPPFAGPETVVDYLGRYTHRVAISNRRLLEVSDGRVRFAYRDRTKGDVPAVADLPAGEFIRRFLLHVLPSGLQRIRHYGFLANRAKNKALPRCRELLGLPPTPAEPSSPPDRTELLARLGIEPSGCPRCHGPSLVPVARLAPIPTRWDPPCLSRPPPDTS